MNASGTRPWADLPEDIVNIISHNLNNIADYLNFGRVCRSWRLFSEAEKKLFVTSQPPLIVHMAPAEGAERSCNFFEIIRSSNFRGYKTKLPKPTRYFGRPMYNTGLPRLAISFCIGVSSGYLIMKHHLCYWLINPVTGHQLLFRIPKSFPKTNFDRVIFASTGSGFLLVVLSKGLGKLRFCTWRNNKQGTWHTFSHEPYFIDDIVAYDGKILAITRVECQIGVFDGKFLKLMFLNLRLAPRTNGSRFIASDEQELFVLVNRLDLYRIDFSKGEWVRLSNLTNQALFVCDNFYKSNMSSRVCSTIQWGDTSNRVHHGHGISNLSYHLQFMRNKCTVYTSFGLFGLMVEEIPTDERQTSPLINCWYFPRQAYSMDYVNVNWDDCI